jgi:CO/xanthine dehydrogenase Mo-binding subunit
VSLDTDAALRLPGVRLILTGQDTLKRKFGPMIADEQILAVDKVRYIGDEVAVVIACDEETAAAALELIEVEYQLLPAVFDPEEAIREGMPTIHEEHQDNRAVHAILEQGDIKQGFAEAELIVEGSFFTPLVNHSYLEPIAVVSHYDQGELKIWGPCQEPFIARDEISYALGLPPSTVRIIQPYVGGGFGGKCDVKLLVVTGLAALKAGWPVRIINSREEEFIAGRPRMPICFHYRSGVRKDGMITAKQVRLLGDNGAYSSQGPPILSVAAMRSDSLYRFHHVRTEAILAYTNKTPTGAFRGFGNPQAHFALESHMDDIADHLAMNPLDLRLLNAAHRGDITCYGWQIDSCGLTECMEKGAERIGWRQKWRPRPAVPPRSGLKRGLGMACMIHVSGNRSVCNEYDGSSAVIQLHEDGRLTVFCGEPDVGQGSATIFAQICAEELGLPLQGIEVVSNDTGRTPRGIGAFASRVTTLGGSAVKLAAEDLRRQLQQFLAMLWQTEAQHIRFMDEKALAPGREIGFAELAQKITLSRCGMELSSFGMFDVGFPLPDPVSRYGNISLGYPFGAQFAEVEVDIATGQVRVVRFVAAQDVGKALNPRLVEGQIEGGVAQGIGYALLEEQVLRNGRIINTSWRDYNLPTAVDLPLIDVIIVESNEPKGPYGAKGAGEAPIVPTAPAIANAIFNAIGIRFNSLPITAEQVYWAIHKDDV